MPDIQLRFNKDMLVLSTPIDRLMALQGFEDASDREYIALCEPELVEEQYRSEKMIGTQCFVTATEGITNARLAHARFEDRAPEMARIAYETAAQFSPEHTIAVVGPTGLPLDETSAVSLKQNRNQYRDAVSALSEFPFDAILMGPFASPYDAQCALMGARAVYDGPLMLTYDVSSQGTFDAPTHTLKDAVQLAVEYGADVVGVSSSAEVSKLEEVIAELRSAVPVPLMVELIVGQVNKRQMYPTEKNPYPNADIMADAAVKLRAWGVQFVRAGGMSSPAYTGALLAMTAGLDVVVDEA